MQQYGGYVKYVEDDIGRPKDKVHKHKERQKAKRETMVLQSFLPKHKPTVSCGCSQCAERIFTKALKRAEKVVVDIDIIGCDMGELIDD